MLFETVRYEKKGNVAYIELHRPEVINVLNVQMRDELFEVLEAVRDDPDVRVLVLSGAGDRGFCAGADLTEFGTTPSQAAARRVRWERDLWGLLHSLRKPIIAALHGYVIGTGLEVACLCDIRIASADAQFGMPELALGLIPGAGGSQTIRRTVGIPQSFDIFFSRTEKRLSADESLEAGLVHRVANRSGLLDEAEKLANILAALDPQVVSATKTAVLDGMDMALEAGLALEDRLARQLRGAA
ncbi:MAG: enoyl-CoA hydratase/isomerase family protein [Chloroflexi bacterium]|nr:enoyl-CoA hydratase/isomerase family protein [Chloroflexota bacterium]